MSGRHRGDALKECAPGHFRNSAEPLGYPPLIRRQRNVPVRQYPAGLAGETELVPTHPIVKRPIAPGIPRQHKTAISGVPERESKISVQITWKLVAPQAIRIENIAQRRTVGRFRSDGQFALPDQPSIEEENEILVDTRGEIVAAGKRDPFILPEAIARGGQATTLRFQRRGEESRVARRGATNGHGPYRSN